MKKKDTRSLSCEMKEFIRLKAVTAIVEQGVSQKDVAQLFGVSANAVASWCKLFKQGGLTALKAKPVGRPKKLSKSGKQMKIIDLFSGCGGFSQGFEKAGFKTLLAIEKDAWAAETYAYNHPTVNVITEDIKKIVPEQLSILPNEVDGIIGGPPCQGFSLSGNRDPKDPRNSLFIEFVRFVKFFQPKFFVMENVPGLLSMRTKNKLLVKDIILDEFSAANYSVCNFILNAADYGVPQSRNRIFFIGIRKDFPFNPDNLQPEKQFSADSYVTLWDALSDLPDIKNSSKSEYLEYPSEAQNAYQIKMREESHFIYNHIPMKHTSRLVERFKTIKFGQSVKDVANEHAQRKRGDASVISGKCYSQNNFRPYPDKPCPTVAASFQSNFIHPFLNRNFTAREGARIQSFPDTYVFKGKRTTMSWEHNLSQYQQIGNAVPPLLAQALGNAIKEYFSRPQKGKSIPQKISLLD